MAKGMRIVVAAVVAWVGGMVCFGQTISWSGGGDGVSWASTANWSGGILPGAANDVVISSGTGTGGVFSAGNVPVKSVQCSKALTMRGGSLTLTAGASQVSGTFAISGGASLTVAGATAPFTANGTTTASSGNLYANSGSAIHLPNLRYTTNSASTTYWRADGANSVLDRQSTVDANNRIPCLGFCG